MADQFRDVLRVRTLADNIRADNIRAENFVADPNVVGAGSYKEPDPLPITIPEDSPAWTRTDDLAILALAREAVALQIDAAAGFARSIADFAADDSVHGASVGSPTPGQVSGRIIRPDGTPGFRLQVALDKFAVGSGRTPTAFTSEDGTFALAIPASMRALDPTTIGMVVSGAHGNQKLPGVLGSVDTNGLLPTVTLTVQLDPIPLSLLGGLQALAAGSTDRDASDDSHIHPEVMLGEDDCELVFRKDTSIDKFPYGVMFRLTDPSLTMPTLTVDVKLPAPGGEGQVVDALLAVRGANGPLDLLRNANERPTFHLVNRVPIDRPLSIDAFRDGLARVRTGLLGGGLPIASSLALGYVVHMAQRWTPVGLALGDLVYSLPLAPGEQQKVAITERTATSFVTESETLDSSEQMSFSERDDTSATATFSTAFREAASGGSHYDSEASSFSVAAAVGGGGVFPFGCVAGGVATSYGTASASGNTNTWMSGSRSATSDAAQNTHSAVQRQASARRRSSRTGMRLATASENTSVVTKTIANHNKTRALTMQYWEVTRVFDVSTAVDGVTLVCLVPLDIVRFLPQFEQPTLSTAPSNRSAVLYRYGELIRHSDVLARLVPPRFRQGLALLNEFVTDPLATVATSSGPAEDIMKVSVSGSFLPIEEVFVTVVSKRGFRIGPFRLSADSPIAPLPVGTTAFANEADLFGELRRRREVDNSSMSASISIPASMPRQDVVGFEISRRFQRLDYHFAPPALLDLGFAKTFLGIDPKDLLGALGAAASARSITTSYQPDRLEQELGGTRLTRFSALVDATVEFATTNWSAGSSVRLPPTLFPIASRLIPPQLGYSALLEIEKTLQWVMRNTMTCSIAVYASLTPEERVVLLERYSIGVPTLGEGGPVESVPLLSCITNNVLGYYGNAMVLPFMIPTALSDEIERTTHKRITTGMLQDSLMRFHVDGFEPPRSTIALPTKGVLGEAVLGHCSSAEKIDLTRFWNWQDSPGDSAPDIAAVQMPTGTLTAGLTGPSALTSMTPMITNFNMSPVAADTSLAAAIAAKAVEFGKPFDIGALTNATNLGTLTGKTLDTAESARKDALDSATKLAEKAMDSAVSIYTGDAAKKKEAGKGDTKPDPKPDPAPGPQPDPTPDPPPTPVPTPEVFPGSDAQHPLSIFFNFDKSDIVDQTNEGLGNAQKDAITTFVTKAKAAGAKAITVKGFASPEGTAAHNQTLAGQRGGKVKASLDTKFADATIVVAAVVGGTLSGQSTQFPRLRRADIFVTTPGS